MSIGKSSLLTLDLCKIYKFYIFYLGGDDENPEGNNRQIDIEIENYPSLEEKDIK